MRNIYQVSLDEKFAAIMLTIARDVGYGDDVIGLIAERRTAVEILAEQAIVAWATERQKRLDCLVPVTNLQHLLHEYCAIADHF